MREELDRKLCEKYPGIFRDRHGDKRVTAMCWGFSCGDGWYTIIDCLCSCIQNRVRNWRDHIKYEKTRKQVPEGPSSQKWKEVRDNMALTEEEVEQTAIVASQVKEKYGGLRFYTHTTSDEIEGMIRMAEKMSLRTCEECGTTEDIGYTQVWVRTLCKPCADKAGYIENWEPRGEDEQDC
jgi:hypothetical protein